MGEFFEDFKKVTGFHLIGGNTSIENVKAHYFNYIVNEIINYSSKDESIEKEMIQMNSIGRVVAVSYDRLIFEVSDFEKLIYNYNGEIYIAQGL